MNTTDRKLRKLPTYENQGGIEILVVLVQVLGVILHGLSFIHRIEIELGVVVLDGWEVDPEGLLNAMARVSLSVIESS